MSPQLTIAILQLVFHKRKALLHLCLEKLLRQKESHAQVILREEKKIDSYRLISMPLYLDNPDPRAVLEDDLGAYDEDGVEWRFFEPKTINEIPNTPDFTPGKAFWLIVREPNKRIDSGPGSTVPTVHPFPVSLSEGTTYWGNPFNFDILSSNLFVASDSLCNSSSNGSIDELWTYENEWRSLPLTASTIRPFDGYVIRTTSAGYLCVDPRRSNRVSSNGVPSKAAGISSVKSSEENQKYWTLRILAKTKNALDTYNFAGIHPDAFIGRDRIDWSEMPGIGDYVSLYFPHPEWENEVTKFSRDIRPVPENGGHTWTFEVSTTIRDRVDLTFEGMDDVPAEYEILLIDPALEQSQDLRELRSYTIAGTKQPRALQLVVGSHAYVDELRVGQDLMPETYEIFPNFPNPFTGSTTLRYGLVEAGPVVLEIYNLLGQRVAVLEQGEEKKAGYHAVAWDGRGIAGESLASGVYFARLQSGSFTQTVKMMLVR